MSLTIQQILDRDLIKDVKLLGGANGAESIVAWVNVMEILDHPETAKKNELLITTGFEMLNYQKHQDLIRQLKSSGAAGLAIQPGLYIDSIPEYIIESANQCNFPVLELPANYSLSEFVHILMNKVTQNHEHFSKEFQCFNSMFLPLKDKIIREDFHFKDESAQIYLFCVSARNTFSVDSKQVHLCVEKIRSYLSVQSAKCVYEINDNGQAAFCLSLVSQRDLPAVAYDFQIHLTFLSEQEGVNFYAGIDRVSSPDYLHLSFEHSFNCISLLDDIAAKRGVCSYDNFTFIKMFGLLYQNNRSFVLDNQALQILLNHDRVNGTNYVHTIRTYLAENCNVSHAAQRLFIHRHTLMNRIQAITDMCGLNFNDYYTRIYMSMALLIHDYFAV